MSAAHFCPGARLSGPWCSPGDPAAQYVPQEAEVIQGDVTDLDSLERFFDLPKGEDAVVIHCASIVALSPEPSQKVYDVNVTGTHNIVDLCVKHAVRKLVYISSTGAIPELEQGRTIVEPERFDPDGVVGYYSKTKALATMYVLEAARERGPECLGDLSLRHLRSQRLCLWPHGQDDLESVFRSCPRGGPGYLQLGGCPGSG